MHISSDAAVQAYPRWGAYGISKAAQDHLARILAAELEGTGVRILSIDPGEMDTAMHAAAVPDADRATLPAARRRRAQDGGLEAVSDRAREVVAPARARGAARSSAAAHARR